jgi:XRE family transcriptional regulator, regulator of sulfur utilization
MSRLARLGLVVAALLAAVAERGTASGPRLSLAYEWTDVKPETTKVGEVRRFFKAPTATVGELSCHVTTLNPGETSHAPHRHPQEEVIVIREGTIESFQEGTTKRLGPGSVIFQGSNELHGFRNVGTVPATYHVFQWNLAPAEKPKP